MAKHNPKAPARGDIADSMNGSAKRPRSFQAAKGNRASSSWNQAAGRSGKWPGCSPSARA